jgi:polyhydroxybutyrate depolymerase
MRHRSLSVLLFLLLAVAFAAGAEKREEHFISVEGLQRRYLLHLPPGWAKQSRAPLILMLHGAGGTPERSGARDLDKYGDEKGFIVAYPEGLHRSWNDGRLIKGRTYHDVAFLSAVIDEIVREDNADPKRAYVTGMSNGGFMSFTLACRISDKIAAIATVVGSMGVGAIENCHPRRAISVMMINGTDDPLVKFEGGKVVRRKGSESEPVGKVVNFWRNQVCGAEKPALNRERLPDSDPNDGSTVTVERVQCAGREVVNYTVEGGGHTWPGGVQYLPKLVVGRVNRDFNASHAIVDFFSAH